MTPPRTVWPALAAVGSVAGGLRLAMWLFRPRQPHLYTEDDRRAQRRRFGEACARAAALLEQHGVSAAARAYRDLAGIAADPGVAFDDEVRQGLHARLPGLPWRVHPRMADDRGPVAPREPWQTEVDGYLSQAGAAAHELRSRGTWH